MDRKLFVIAHDIRSAHNVGALLRVADGLGIERVYLSGYTPFPRSDNDNRLPHIADKLHKQIQKTALGAEESQTWEHVEDIYSLIESLQRQGVTCAALEQNKTSQLLHTYSPPEKIALILGREVEGLQQDILKKCDVALEIPMLGNKESHNVSQAAAMSLYYCRFMSKTVY